MDEGVEGPRAREPGAAGARGAERSTLGGPATQHSTTMVTATALTAWS